MDTRDGWSKYSSGAEKRQKGGQVMFKTLNVLQGLGILLEQRNNVRAYANSPKQGGFQTMN
jgi:hypothetical protein